uniref:transposase n=1 Tax=Elizabethkingia argenteiflava TaxID=2681556 RepID=UPI00293BE26E|nr:transposase [Elizabethkingia argenteiflava]
MAVGLNRDGRKEVLGMWLGKSESSAFWMGVFTDLKARDVEDILITTTYHLNRFTQTVGGVFRKSQTQIRVVHQIRNACKYVVWKQKRMLRRYEAYLHRRYKKKLLKLLWIIFKQNGKANILYATIMEKQLGRINRLFEFPIQIRKNNLNSQFN